MMRSSESLGALAAALVKAQGSFPVVPKSHTGKIKGTNAKGDPYEYEYSYADLSDTLQAVTPGLSANGLCVLQFVGVEDVLTTRVMHESGEWLEDSMCLPIARVDKNGMPVAVTAQVLGSAITYARRYALSAALGIATEADDDGNAASQSSGQSRSSTASITEGQLDFLNDIVSKKGLADDIIAFTFSVIGRTVVDPKTLTKAEASQLLEALKAHKRGDPVPDVQPAPANTTRTGGSSDADDIPFAPSYV
jgi:hypothetical protein